MRLKELREEHHYTKKFVSEYLKCSVKTYSNYETGVTVFRARVLKELANLYNVSTDYIVGLTDNRELY